MKRKTFLSLCTLLMMLLTATLASAETSWKEIADDGNYAKLFQPGSVKTLEQVNGVATKITAKIKATYSFDAAVETIENYEIANVITDPSRLSYSIATVEVNPQHRTIEYVNEEFFDENDNKIWEKVYNPRTTKEINSMSFEEDYYAAIVDIVFRQGEADRCKASDRWRSLWNTTDKTGMSTAVMADTSTMRQRGEDNILYWEWTEVKDVNGAVKEVKFLKKTVKLSDGTEKVLQGRTWNAENGWQSVKASGQFVKISDKGPQAGGLMVLRAYTKGYQYWLNRYRTDKIVTLPTKK